jgi:hypothetical protein
VLRELVVGVFILVIASLVILVKWELKRARRTLPPLSKAFQRKLDERRNDPGNSYVAPVDRTTRAFQHKTALR